MSNELPITIQMGALPPNLNVTPQELADLMAARMSLVTSTSYALFVTGSTEPTSNVGPWLKDGVSWYVWSDSDGAYVPQEIAPVSLGYWIGPYAPDPATYNFWIKTAAGGSPLALMVYYGGGWVDVYATALGSYLTVAAFATAIASYSTTAQMNAAIAAAVSAATFATYPAQATNTVPQSVNVNATAQKVVLNTAPINPSPVPFDTANSKYIAPAQGNYCVSVEMQVDNNTGTASSMQICMSIYRNGAPLLGSCDPTPSPVGSRWFPDLSGTLVTMAENDELELYITPDDGVNVGLVDLTTVRLNVFRVSA